MTIVFIIIINHLNELSDDEDEDAKEWQSNANNDPYIVLFLF